jgi:UDP-N-acetylmuramoyl-L-alanyl-D-glutamate--2,6-diaminopimelate ligase
MSKPTYGEILSQVRQGKFTGVTSDSRQVKAGTLFVAVSGLSQDGHAFAAQAVQQGATAVVGEQTLSLSAPYLQVRDSRAALADLATAFYGDPSLSLKMAAVTGTSGKTTTTYILESILQAAGAKVGVIGTVNFRFGKKVYPSTHTTPGPVELQKLLAEMKSDGCTHVVMEVSSHALKQHRVGGIAFDTMGFSNLTPEHLDFHPDMEDYFRSKAMLFTDFFEKAIQAGKKPVRVINADDQYGLKLLGLLGANTQSSVPNSPQNSVDAYAIAKTELKDSLAGISGRMKGRGGDKDGTIHVQSNLMGQFNVSNLLCAIGMAQGLGVPTQAIEEGIKRLPAVPGRLERVPNSKGIYVFVDYAHKSDALEKVLKNLQGLKAADRKIITVFGCGGDRDRIKRPVMGRIAVELSDEVIVTSDNPRTEDPHAIIGEIVAGIEEFRKIHPARGPYQVEADRKKAIEKAIQIAKPGDLVLIAGKGHEDYQIIGTQKVHFDDREVAAQALS